MLIVALVLAVIGLAALVAAVVTGQELVAWVCIGASVLGVLLLIIDAIRERQRGEGGAADGSDDESAGEDAGDEDSVATDESGESDEDEVAAESAEPGADEDASAEVADAESAAQESGEESAASGDEAESGDEPVSEQEPDEVPSPQGEAADGVQHITGVASPLRLSATPPVLRNAPPALGQHTDEVLRELVLVADRIAALRAAKAI